MSQLATKNIPSSVNDRELTQHLELASAFASFNDFSEQLERSYQQLQSKVQYLATELAAARVEKHREFKKKERISQQLDSILIALPAGVLVLDSRRKIILSNPCAEDYLGKCLLGKQWDELIASLSTHAKNTNEVVFADGRILMISQCVKSLAAGDIILLQDVTENRRLELEMQRGRRLVEMGQMLANLSHQFKTPLASVMLYVSQLKNGGETSSQQINIHNKSMRSLHELDQMVNDTLRYARGESLQMTYVDSGLIVNEVIQSIDAQLTSQKSYLRVDCADNVVKILCNPQALSGAIVSLLYNSIQAGGVNTHLILRMYLGTQGSLIIEVEDDGPGIDEGLAEQIFDPYFTTKHQGTGLGLALVLAVVSTHNGTIELLGNRLLGALFRICLPTQAVSEY